MKTVDVLMLRSCSIGVYWNQYYHFQGHWWWSSSTTTIVSVHIMHVEKSGRRVSPKAPLSSEISLCKATLTDFFFFFFLPTLMCKEARSCTCS